MLMRKSLTLAVVALLLDINGCSRDKTGAITYKYLRQISGANAKDCGYVRFGESTAQTDQCVMDAYKRHQPFIARYDVKGLDSRLVLGLAGDGTEKIVSVKYDSEGWERPSRTGASLVEGNHVLLTPCPVPVQFSKEQSGHLACYQ
ncbi:MAG TPA: hypothetical protein VN622_03360 [Clostridia bacterium]|nr:hypothetical protein [Clostridia bacterium]